MYAVIRTGGKQYRVTSGDVIAVEKLAGEADETITFDDVLLIGDEKSQTVGSPVVDGASVVDRPLGVAVVEINDLNVESMSRQGGDQVAERGDRVVAEVGGGGEGHRLPQTPGSVSSWAAATASSPPVGRVRPACHTGCTS